MAETTYIFSIADDTKNGVWDEEHLRQDVKESPKFHRELLTLEEVTGCMHLTFHDVLPAVEEEYLEYLISMHDGTPVNPNELYTEEGALVVSPTYGKYDEAGRFKGVGLKAEANATSMVDYELTTEIYLLGAEYWIHNGHWGDKIDFSIVDKNDTLGLFSMFGLSPGEDVLELVKHVKEYPVKPGEQAGSFYPPSRAEVASGLFLRFKYENDSNEDAYLGVTFFCFEV